MCLISRVLHLSLFQMCTLTFFILIARISCGTYVSCCTQYSNPPRMLLIFNKVKLGLKTKSSQKNPVKAKIQTLKDLKCSPEPLGNQQYAVKPEAIIFF